MKALKYALAATSFGLLAACGGGGGGGGSGVAGPVASTNTFDVLSGWRRLVSAGWTKTFSVSGTCSGSFTITSGAVSTPATFEGVTALSGTDVSSFSWTGCTPASGSTTSVDYYDSNYVPKGRIVQGVDYGVWLTPQTLPSNARVGDVSIIGTLTLYTNSSKTTPAGREDSTLVIEADSATTAIANLISKSYDAAGNLEYTQQNRYRIAADGSLTPISFDVQYANGTRLIGN